MYAVGPSRQKACQEMGRYFSSDANYAMPKKLRQCSVCSHFGLSTTPTFCNVCSQYGIVRGSNDGPKVARPWPDTTDIPLFCKECSQYVLSSSPRFCLACSQHDGSPPTEGRSSPDPSKRRAIDCFRNEREYNRFLESCANTRSNEDSSLTDDFSPKGHAWGGGDDLYEVTVNRAQVRGRSPLSRGRNMNAQDREGSKSRGKSRGIHESSGGYGGLQESVAKMVACYGAKTSHLARRSRDLPCGRSPARSPRACGLGAGKTPQTAPAMNTCADHGLSIPSAPCLTPCAAHGMHLA